MLSNPTTVKTSGAGMALAGILLFLGGLLHPRADTGGGYESAVAELFSSPGWNLSHLLMLVGFGLLAVSLVGLLRSGGVDSDRKVRVLTAVGAAGAGLAAIETVPHLLAASEAEAVLEGDATPFTSAHSILQAFATPLLGLGLAALSVVGARGRVLGRPVFSVFAVVGGVSFAIAGPAILLLREPGVAVLFAGAQGLALWLIAAGVGLARREALARPQPAPTTATS